MTDMEAHIAETTKKNGKEMTLEEVGAMVGKIAVDFEGPLPSVTLRIKIFDMILAGKTEQEIREDILFIEN